jgi:hypothetical protein
MNAVVVDTNVCIVANEGHAPAASGSPVTGSGRGNATRG